MRPVIALMLWLSLAQIALAQDQSVCDIMQYTPKWVGSLVAAIVVLGPFFRGLAEGMSAMAEYADKRGYPRLSDALWLCGHIAGFFGWGTPKRLNERSKQ